MSNQHQEVVSTWRDINFSQMQKLKFYPITCTEGHRDPEVSLCRLLFPVSALSRGLMPGMRLSVTILTYAM